MIFFALFLRNGQAIKKCVSPSILTYCPANFSSEEPAASRLKIDELVRRITGKTEYSKYFPKIGFRSSRNLNVRFLSVCVLRTMEERKVTAAILWYM